MSSDAADDSKVPLIERVNICLAVVTTMAVAGRVWTNAVTLGTFRLDDAFVLASYLSMTLMLIFVLLMATVGFGIHFRAVNPDTLDRYLLYAYPTLDTYIWSFVFSKMAFAIYFIRIFPQKTHKQVNIGILVFLLIQGIVETVVAQLMCATRAKLFLPELPGKCLDTMKFYYASFVLKLVSDIILFIQPLPTLYKLRMAWAKKIIIFLLLSLGLGVCVASIIRVQLIPRTRSSDPTYDLVDAMLWSEVEVSALIICVCVPEIHLLVQRIWPLVLPRSASPRSPRAGHIDGDEACGRDLGGRLRRIIGRAKIKTSHGSWYNTPSGASSGASRRARFGVISSVSAGRQPRPQRGTEGTGRTSRQSLVDGEPGQEPASPEHGGILVTHDIEIGIEIDENHVPGMDLAELERAAHEDEAGSVDGGDRDSMSTEMAYDSRASSGEQGAHATSD